jgi:hypothetical protein
MKASKERMSLWRRFKQLGAAALKNSVYILPDSEKTYEEFQRLGEEIQSMGGDATLVRANGIENLDDEDIIGLFNVARDGEYMEIISACEALLKRYAKGSVDKDTSVESDILNKELNQIEKRLKGLTEIDYFNASLGKDADRLFLQCTKVLKSRRQKAETAVFEPLKKEDFQGKKWATRKGPRLSTIAGAWVIRKFIDPKAEFIFFKVGEEIPVEAVPFDMPGAEFGQHGEDCTMETFLRKFAIKNPAAWELSRIVHDAVRKDGKYGKEEAKGVNIYMKGLNVMHEDDLSMLEDGIRFMECLFKVAGK